MQKNPNRNIVRPSKRKNPRALENTPPVKFAWKRYYRGQ
jgi:hypothetical protein